MKKILDYEEMIGFLDSLNKDVIVKKEPLGFTDFDTPILHYTYGEGEEHVVVTAGTHSVELITNIFVLNLMKNLSDGKINLDKSKYTIHFIPIYNPDGTIICTSAIRKVLPRSASSIQGQLLCTQFYLNSRTDDFHATNFKDKDNKLVHEMFKYATVDDIDDKYADLKLNLTKIMKESNLPRGIMVNWSSNGNGVDLNANIECGVYLERFKNNDSEYSSLRYNQINNFKVGPIGCPSRSKEFISEKENVAFLEFLENLISKHKVIGVFVYHASGGSVHYLDFMEEKNYWLENYGIREINYNRNVAKVYAEEANYKLYKPTTYTTFCSKIRSLVPGSLVLELTKLRSNPLSQFINIDIAGNLEESDTLTGEFANFSNNYTNTMKSNFLAFTRTIEAMSEEYFKYNYHVLVNRENKCPDLNFEIINPNSRYNSSCKIERKTFEAFCELRNRALEEGYDIDVESGYRSVEHQKRVYLDIKNKKGEEHANKYVAKPGYSEHHTGLAVDVCLKKDDKFLIDHDLPEDFSLFLANNCALFGFIIRYQKGKEEITGYASEPWHLRYVGKTLAKYLMDNNLTLEEYYEELKKSWLI